jgi:hypothetical protein
MDQDSFKNLTLHKKLQWVHFEGESVMSIRYYGYKVILYLLTDFYVEIFYHNIDGEIVRADILDMQSTRMQFYCDQISLRLN